jgi:integrase
MATVNKRPDHPKHPWEVTWRDPDTKRLQRKSFRTKKEADELRDTVSTEIRQDTYVTRRPISFKTFTLDWLARTEPTVSPNTHALHAWAVEGYLLPAFGLLRLQRLQAERIERWQAKMLRGDVERPGTDAVAAGKKKIRKPLSTRSVEICRTVLGTILEDARKKKYLAVNPMADVATFDVPKRELHFLTPMQVKALCELVGPFYAVLYLILAFCGIRIGEATGLQRGDLDLERRLLFIRRQDIWHKKKCPHKEKKCRRRGPACPHGETACQQTAPTWEITPPKTEHGIRVVEIPAPMVPLLIAHRDSLTGRPNLLDLVFPNEVGTPLYPKNIRRRHFIPAMKKLGIPDVRQHDLRRTFIAAHVEARTHPKLIQERAGHSRFSVTMDIYAKIVGKMPLGKEEEAKLNDITMKALPAFTPEGPEEESGQKPPEDVEASIG